MNLADLFRLLMGSRGGGGGGGAPGGDFVSGLLEMLRGVHNDMPTPPVVADQPRTPPPDLRPPPNVTPGGDRPVPPGIAPPPQLMTKPAFLSFEDYQKPSQAGWYKGQQAQRRGGQQFEDLSQQRQKRQYHRFLGGPGAASVGEERPDWFMDYEKWSKGPGYSRQLKEKFGFDEASERKKQRLYGRWLAAKNKGLY